MKKLQALLFFAASTLSAQAQNIAGTWEGKLSISGTPLRILVHIKNEGGRFTATMDSPDQGTKDIPVTDVVFKDDSLFLNMAVSGAKVFGKVQGDTAFQGQFQQGVNLPLRMRKLRLNETPTELKRPQTPKPPFPYQSKEVLYYNSDRSIQFGGTVTYPNGDGPFPCLLLLTGSGQQNRDEEIFGHRSFAVLADYLTRQGFMVLRVDDRGVGQTTGDVPSATTRDFANDALVSLDYLRLLPQADKNKMGLLGHSEGGLIAQMVAAERSDVTFVVLLAAPGQKILDLMTEQNRAVLQSSGMAKEAVESYVQLYKPLAGSVATAPSNELARLGALGLVENWLKRVPPQHAMATTGVTDEASKQKFVTSFVRELRKPWFRYFLLQDPRLYLQKTKARVLALNGDKDIQVAAVPNLAAIKSGLQKSKSVEVQGVPGVNHLFQTCHTCTIAEYVQLEETISPQVLQLIGAWLKKNVQEN